MPVNHEILNQFYTELSDGEDSATTIKKIYETLKFSQDEIDLKKRTKEFEVIHYLFSNFATHVLSKEDEARKIENAEKIKELLAQIEKLTVSKKTEEAKRKADESKESLARIQAMEVRIAAIGKEILKIKTENPKGLNDDLHSRLELLEKEKTQVKTSKDQESKLMKSAAQGGGTPNTKEIELELLIKVLRHQVAEIEGQNEQKEKDVLAFRRECLKIFFSKPENLKYLGQQDSQKRIPALIMLGFERGHDEEFVKYILENTPDIRKYRYKNLASNGDEEVSDDSVSSKVSDDIENEIEGQTLLDYMILQQAAGKNSAKIAVALYDMGVPFSHKFEYDVENPVLNKLLESRSLQNGIAKALCLHLLAKGDASLFFNLLRYQSGRAKNMSTVPSQSHSRKDSVASGSARSASAPSVSAEITKFFNTVLEEAIKNGSIYSAVDPATKENVGSFLLRKKDDDKGAVQNFPIRIIWNSFQSVENFQLIPIEMLFLRNNKGKTFLHHVAATNDSHLVQSLMLKVIAQWGREKWKELISIADSEGNLPLHIACEKGFDAGIKYLSDAEILARTNVKGATPLSIVIDKDFTDSCKFLLRLGAFDKRLPSKENEPKEKTRDRKHIGRRFSAISDLLDQEEDNAEYYVMSNEHYPTAIAVDSNRERILKDLMRYGFDPNQKFLSFDEENNYVETSLLERAIEKKSFDAAATLIKYGAKTKSDDGEYLDFIANLSDDHAQKLSVNVHEKYYVKNGAKNQQKIRTRRAIAPFCAQLIVKAVDYIIAMQRSGCDPDIVADALKLCDDLFRLEDREALSACVEGIEDLVVQENVPETLLILDLAAEIEKKLSRNLNEGAKKILHRVKTLLPLHSSSDEGKESRAEALKNLDRVLDSVNLGGDVLVASMKVSCKRFVSLMEEATTNNRFVVCQNLFEKVLTHIKEFDPTIPNTDPKKLINMMGDLEDQVWKTSPAIVVEPERSPQVKSGQKAASSSAAAGYARGSGGDSAEREGAAARHTSSDEE